MTDLALTSRNATLEDLAGLLARQQTAKCDMIVPATRMRAVDGRIVVSGVDPILEEDGSGITDPNGEYALTTVADEGVASKLKIPLSYVRWTRENRPDLWDANVNGLLHGRVRYNDDGDREVVYAADRRNFLFRTFISGDPDLPHIGRALLSDGYKVVDNLDMLTAALAGIKEAGLEISPEWFTADLSERNMYLRVVAPQITTEAEALLKDYRSPFADPTVKRAGEAAARWGGMDGAGNASVSAGIEVRNSETGDGGWSIAPYVLFHACTNGMTFRMEAFKGVHLGGKKAEGIVRWSDDTRRKELAVVTAKCRDAVKTFLSMDWLTGKIRELEEVAGTPVADVEGHVKAVAKELNFSDDYRAGILNHFIRGGQLTAGGVMQAVTSFAQTVDDPDAAAELRDVAVDALATSARLATAGR